MRALLLVSFLFSQVLFAQPRRIDSRLMDAGWVTSMAYSPDGKQLFYVVSDSKALTTGVRVADVKTGREISRSEPFPSRGEYGAFSADGKLYAIGIAKSKIDVSSSTDRVRIMKSLTGPFELRVAEIAGGRVVQTLTGSRFPIKRPAFSRDGTFVAAATGLSPFLEEGGDLSKIGGEVVVWELASGKKLHAFESEEAEFTDVAFSPDGKLLVAPSTDQSVRFWDLETAKEVRRLPAYRTGGTVRFSPDGKLLAYCGRGPEVRLIDVATGEQVRVISAAPLNALDIAFSADGRQIVVGTGLGDTREARKNGGQVRVFETDSGREIRSLRADKQLIGTVAFDPAGASLAFAGVSAAPSVLDLPQP